MTFHLNSFVVGNPNVTSQCWDWCSEQNFIHQSNINTGSLMVVGLALLSLILNHVILDFRDEIMEYTDLTESFLEKVYVGSSYFASAVLIVFLLVNTVFN